jgi:hypothetical protein
MLPQRYPPLRESTIGFPVTGPARPIAANLRFLLRVVRCQSALKSIHILRQYAFVASAGFAPPTAMGLPLSGPSAERLCLRRPAALATYGRLSQARPPPSLWSR